VTAGGVYGPRTVASVATTAALAVDQLFPSLDLARPGLETVAAAVVNHDPAAAKYVGELVDRLKKNLQNSAKVHAHEPWETFRPGR
jgi:hypothetical protein